MNNLPTDKNQPVDNNQNVTTETPPVTPPKTLPNPSSATPSDKQPETTPSSSEEQPKEQPIEVGSLEQPSFTSYTQGATDDDSNPKKGKKLKTIASVLGILLIIIALPLAVVLVKQRQDIRKSASESQPAFNDIQITFESETAPSSSNGGTYSTNFKVANTVSSTKTVVVKKEHCYCSAGSPSGGCNDNCSSENATLTLGGNQSTNVTISARQSSGSICGSFQTDLTVLSVN
ncbi:hypothetical protein MUP50_01340 [Patescibacteria group bacterium]|nr:hypothetical protein [Patescibacteria group bacterium]